MQPDSELLRRFKAEASEDAFAEIVQRHIALVYRIALARLQEEQGLADDVAQAVFISLALHARDLSGSSDGRTLRVCHDRSIPAPRGRRPPISATLENRKGV